MIQSIVRITEEQSSSGEQIMRSVRLIKALLSRFKLRPEGSDAFGY